MLAWALNLGIIIAVACALVVALLGGEFTERDTKDQNIVKATIAIIFRNTTRFTAWRFVFVAILLFVIYAWVFHPKVLPGGFYNG